MVITLLDMRKALSRDVEKKSIVPLKRPVTPEELEYDWFASLELHKIVLVTVLDADIALSKTSYIMLGMSNVG